MLLGDIIKKYRSDHEISMQIFARTAGLSKAYIGQLEKNINPRTGKPINPNADTLDKIARAMAMDLNDLISRLGDDGIQYEKEVVVQSDMRLRDEEKQLVRDYRRLDERGKKIVSDTMKTALEYSKK
jgi:transcriptional regulator with XRE-family HTH domain